jgi:hypothetical protein
MGYVQQNKWKAGRIFSSLNLIIDKIHIPNRVNFVLKEIDNQTEFAHLQEYPGCTTTPETILSPGRGNHR